MSDERKTDYDVGIPLDELPPPEMSSDENHDDSLTTPDNDAPDEPADLPDLFAPEELVEVGLATDLPEPVETREDDEGLEAPASEAKEQEAAGATAPDPPSDNLAAPPSDPDAVGLAESPPPAETAPLDPLEQTAVESVPPVPVTAQDGLEKVADDVAPSTDAMADFEEAVSEEDLEVGVPLDEQDRGHDLVVGHLERLNHQISELQREFEGKLKYDAHKDQIIDRLHSELQAYKQDILKKYVLSIVMDVVKVADDIRKWLSYFRSLEVSQRDPRKLFRYLEAIPSDLEDVFYWHGVKPFTSEDGLFDPARQRAIKKIPTDDPAMDKNVAHSIRPGYEWETKVIRQEMVAVYVYQAEQESLNTGNSDE